MGEEVKGEEEVKMEEEPLEEEKVGAENPEDIEEADASYIPPAEKPSIENE